MVELERLRVVLASLPEVREINEGAQDSQDMLSIASEFAKLLRKIGVQQMRDGADVVSAVKEASSRVEEVHQAALDERDRAVHAERQTEQITKALVAHFDFLNRALEVMSQAPGLEKWAEQLASGLDRGLADAEKAGVVAIGRVGEPFDAAAHDCVNEIARTDVEVVVRQVVRRGYALNGRVLRRAQVEIAAKK